MHPSLPLLPAALAFRCASVTSTLRSGAPAGCANHRSGSGGSLGADCPAAAGDSTARSLTDSGTRSPLVPLSAV